MQRDKSNGYEDDGFPESVHQVHRVEGDDEGQYGELLRGPVHRIKRTPQVGQFPVSLAWWRWQVPASE